MNEAGKPVLMPYAAAISPTITTPPIQKAEKLPAVRPDSTLSDAPPSRLDVTTSFTCVECTDVKNVVTSGMIAPASVPQVITLASRHHRSPPSRSWINRYDAMYVQTIEMIDASQTSVLSGVSKFIFRRFEYRALAITSLITYASPLAITITSRITKIQTSSFTWFTCDGTAS